MKRLLILLVLSFTLPHSQASTWEGNINSFIFDQNTIQLNDSTESTSSIYTPNKSKYFDFTVSLDFKPSSSNYLIIYLQTKDTSIFSDAIYLKIGQSGNTDVLELYQRKNNTTNLLAYGTSDFSTIITALNIIAIKDSNDFWSIYTSTNQAPFKHELTSFSNLQIEHPYFGYHCTYTKTRSKGFTLNTPTFHIDPSILLPHNSSPNLFSYGDLEVSEILYDPDEDQAEFIEIVNLSNKPISLEKLIVERDKTISTPLNTDFILESNEAICITNFNEWETPPINCIDVNLFTLLNDGSTISILNQNLTYIDSISYSPKQHSVLTNHHKGHSLIRNNGDWMTNPNPSPGYITTSSSSHPIILSHEFIDFKANLREELSINYSFTQAQSANCFLINSNGLIVEKILNNSFIGTTGTYQWAPKFNTTLLTTGIYIVFWESWDSEGNKTLDKYAITIVH